MAKAIATVHQGRVEVQVIDAVDVVDPMYLSIPMRPVTPCVSLASAFSPLPPLVLPLALDGGHSDGVLSPWVVGSGGAGLADAIRIDLGVAVLLATSLLVVAIQDRLETDDLSIGGVVIPRVESGIVGEVNSNLSLVRLWRRQLVGRLVAEINVQHGLLHQILFSEGAVAAVEALRRLEIVVGCASSLGAAALFSVLALLVARLEVDLLRVDGSAAVLAGVMAESEGTHLGGRGN